MNPALDLELPTAEGRDRAALPAQASELLDGARWSRAAVGDSVLRRFAPRRAPGASRSERRPGRSDDQRRARWDRMRGRSRRSPARVSAGCSSSRRSMSSFAPLVEGRGGDEFVFGSAGVPFEPRAMERRARRAWKTENGKRAKEAERQRRTPCSSSGSACTRPGTRSRRSWITPGSARPAQIGTWAIRRPASPAATGTCCQARSRRTRSLSTPTSLGATRGQGGRNEAPRRGLARQGAASKGSHSPLTGRTAPPLARSRFSVGTGTERWFRHLLFLDFDWI